MAIWRISNTSSKSLAEREIWIHLDKGTIVRETLFTNGAYTLFTEDNNPPKFELEAVPGGDGEVDSVDLNFCGYETQLIGLDGAVRLKITWPDSVHNDERQSLAHAWDEGMHESWEGEGWSLDDIEVWFWGDLNIELLEPSNIQNSIVTHEDNDGWFLSSSPPPNPGIYKIETLEKVVWPNFPITESSWNGEQWQDEDGEMLVVKKWKYLKAE